VIVLSGAGVGPVVAGLVPLAVVVALSPAPIIAVVLMLLTPRAGGTSASFLVGWLVGLAGVTTAFLLLAGDLTPQSTRQSSDVAAWAELGLGVLLLALAGQQWWSRPQAGQERRLPRWMEAIDRFTAARAGGLGLVLSTVNPTTRLKPNMPPLKSEANAAVGPGGGGAGVPGRGVRPRDRQSEVLSTVAEAATGRPSTTSARTRAPSPPRAQ